MNNLTALINGAQKPLDPISETVVATVTLAQLNAGYELVPASMQSYRVTDFKVIVNGGAMAALTSVEIESSADTPVVVASFAQAQMTEDAVLVPGASGVTLGAGFAAGLGLDKAINITVTGDPGTTAVSLTVILTLQRIAGIGFATG